MPKAMILVTLLLLVPSAQAEDGAGAYQKAVDSVALVYCIDREWDVTTGSGVVINAEGYLITAAHCIRSGGLTQVMFPERDKEGRVVAESQHYEKTQSTLFVPYVVVAMDPKHDLALLKPKFPRTGMKPIPLADEASPGQSVCAIGNGQTIRFRYSSGSVKQVYNGSFTTVHGTTDARLIDSTADFAPGRFGRSTHEHKRGISRD